MTKLTTFAALAALATSGFQPALADQSRNPGLAIYQEHLPSWMRGTNDEAGGPANELIDNGGARLPPSRYAVSPGGIAAYPTATGSLSRPSAPVGVVDLREWSLHNSAR